MLAHKVITIIWCINFSTLKYILIRQCSWIATCNFLYVCLLFFPREEKSGEYKSKLLLSSRYSPCSIAFLMSMMNGEIMARNVNLINNSFSNNENMCLHHIPFQILAIFWNWSFKRQKIMSRIFFINWGNL